MKRPMLLRTLALLAAACCAIGAGQAAAKQPKALSAHAKAAIKKPAAALLIRPGVSIGPIKLGASESEVTRLLGAPDDTTPIAGDRHISQWSGKSLLVGFEGGKAVLVSTHSNVYGLASGLKVGSFGSQAKEQFPNLTTPTVSGMFGLTDEAVGINFLAHPTDNDGEPLMNYDLPPNWTIDEINVFLPPQEVPAPAHP